MAIDTQRERWITAAAVEGIVVAGGGFPAFSNDTNQDERVRLTARLVESIGPWLPRGVAPGELDQQLVRQALRSRLDEIAGAYMTNLYWKLDFIDDKNRIVSIDRKRRLRARKLPRGRPREPESALVEDLLGVWFDFFDGRFVTSVRRDGTPYGPLLDFLLSFLDVLGARLAGITGEVPHRADLINRLDRLTRDSLRTRVRRSAARKAVHQPRPAKGHKST